MASADLAGKRGNDGLADSPTKLDSTVLADSVAKRGIDGLVDSELKGESAGLPVNRRSPKGVPIYGNR